MLRHTPRRFFIMLLAAALMAAAVGYLVWGMPWKSASTMTTEHDIEVLDTESSDSLDMVEVPVTASPESEESTTTSPAPNITSAVRPVAWGAYVGYSSQDLAAFERLVGASVDIRAVFVNWNDPFPASFGAELAAAGKTMLIFWEQYGVTLDNIMAGESDAYIKNFASAARSYGGQIILAPLHEMNGDWDPWGGSAEGNTPARVVDAWRHIVDVFGDVPNVAFVWAVNNISVPNTPDNAIERYYPGDAYVDYVAVDGFNFGDPWLSFEQTFSAALATLKQYGKPIYILSMASAEGPRKAAWIEDAFLVQVPRHPEIRGWVWFNENKERDWRVNSDPVSLEAFRSVVSKYAE